MFTIQSWTGHEWRTTHKFEEYVEALEGIRKLRMLNPFAVVRIDAE